MNEMASESPYDLLISSSHGDIDAYGELFDRYGQKLYNFAYYLTYSREEAQDITSDTFIRVFEALQGREVSSFNLQAYLYKTARNLSLKTIEIRKREGLTLEEASEFAQGDIFADPERAALLTEQREKVKDASSELTDDQQAALLLKELEGLPYDTIAEVLDSNPNAVGALLSRARLKFREVYRMAHAQAEGISDDCAQVTPLLSKYIDGEMSAGELEQVGAHLEACPICNENLASMRDASVTYRSLIPMLPFAAVKVWSAAKGVLIGGEAVATAAHASGAASATGAASAGATGGLTAAASSSAAGATAAAATTAAVATGMALITKIIAIVAAVLVSGGLVTGGYFITTKVIFAKKTVPNLVGLKEAEAKKKTEEAGLKYSTSYKDPGTPKTGNEVVVEQSSKPGTEVEKNTTIKVSLADKDMAEARKTAETQISKANTALQEVQGMGVDISDLASTIQQAQAKHDTAKTVNDYTGPTDSSTYYANLVMQQCDAKKAADQAQKERERQISHCRAVIESYINSQSNEGWTGWIDTFWMNDGMTKAAAGTSGATPARSPQYPSIVKAVREGDTWKVVSDQGQEKHRFPLTIIEESELPW